MVKAQNIPEAEEPAPMGGIGDLFMVALPMPTVKALSDIAAKQNMTFAQLLAKAINDCILQSQEGDNGTGPR